MPFATVGTEFLVNTTTARDQYQSAMTALADGRFVVTWTDDSRTGGDTSGAAVRGQIFAADGTKSGAEFLVNTITTLNQTESSVTALADGRFAVTWTDRSDGPSGGDVRGQIFATDGSKSGVEFLVNTTSDGVDQTEPDVTALADGRFVVTWTDQSATGGDTSGAAVRGQIFDAGGTKSGAEFLVNTTTLNSQYESAVTALADGRFVVTWTDQSATGGVASCRAVRGQIFAADGAKSGAEFQVNTTTASVQQESSLTALADGRFVVTWSDFSQANGDTSNAAVRGQIFAADGTKSGAEFLVNTTTTNGQFEGVVTALADGRFVVTWTDFSFTGGDSSDTAVRGQIFAADGSKSGLEFLVNTTTTGYQNWSSVTALADGRFVVTFTDTSATGGGASNNDVRGQIFNALAYTGDATAETVTGGTLSDTISGLGGNDVISGGDGNDFLHGDLGNDRLTGGDGFDAMYGGGGDDIIFMDFADNAGGTIDGGAGYDYVHLTGTNGVTFNMTAAGVEWFGGNAGADVVTAAGTATGIAIWGRGGTDNLTGGDGGDILIGGADADSLFGGAGNDGLYGNEVYAPNLGSDGAGDAFDGGAGSDVMFVDRADTVLGQINGGADYDYVVVRDTAGAAWTVAAGSGVEWVAGDSGADSINASALTDGIVLHGYAGNDTLVGGSGSDSLYGETDDDDIEGGDGIDHLFGGAGNDRFVFNAASGGIDYIYDWNNTTDADKLVLVGGGGPLDVSVEVAYGNTIIHFGDQAIVFLGIVNDSGGPGVAPPDIVYLP